jgi:hypothetical protein
LNRNKDKETGEERIRDRRDQGKEDLYGERREKNKDRGEERIRDSQNMKRVESRQCIMPSKR